MYGLPCLPLIQERFLNAIKPHLSDDEKLTPNVRLYLFPQMWGSTALGFPGVGGQAMTLAYTTVILDDSTGWTAVFFHESLAYKIKNPNDIFYKDLYNFKMKSVMESIVYYDNKNIGDDNPMKNQKVKDNEET